MSDIENRTGSEIVGQHFYATKPTGITLRLRTNLLFQIWRFIRINFKMLKIISKSHH